MQLIALTVLAAILLGTATAEAARRSPRIKGEGETLALKALRAKHKLTDAEMERLLGAVGRIRCNWGVATAFLLGGADVAVTSGHVFVETDPRSKHKGRSKGSARACAYYPLLGKGRYRFAKNSLIEGPNTAGRGLSDYWTDWAVVRLERPVPGARPFMPGQPHVKTREPTIVVSQGMNDTITRICTGAIDKVFGGSSLPGFTSTCDSGPGASGGPVIAGDLKSARQGRQPVVGLTLGWISLPGAQARHFAVPLDRDLMVAVGRSLSDSAIILEIAAFYRMNHGLSVAMSLIAQELYAIAAMRGEPEAYYWLGQIHLDAFSDLPEDKIEAFGWLELAVESLPREHAVFERAVAGLAELSTSLDSSKWQEGRQRVKAVLAGSR